MSIMDMALCLTAPLQSIYLIGKRNLCSHLNTHLDGKKETVRRPVSLSNLTSYTLSNKNANGIIVKAFRVDSGYLESVTARNQEDGSEYKFVCCI